MPKYLNTKPGSLESAVLEAVSPAQQAAIAISKKERGEKPKKEEMKKIECPQCKGEGCDHCDNKGYHMVKDEELTAKQKKIDMNKDGKITGDDLAKLRAKGAKKEEVKEETSLAELAAKHISDMWAEAAKSDKKEEEEPKSKKETKTTMTGKPMSNVEVTPNDKEDK